MAVTYKKIATATAGSGGSSTFDFTSIPSTYTDLVLHVSARCTTDNANAKISFNGSTSSFTSRLLEAEPGIVYSASRTDNLNLFFITPSSYTASTFGSAFIYIANYAGSTNKSFSTDSCTENNATASVSRLLAGLWSNTAAINQITLTPQGTAFAQYSTATLYGISKS